MEWDKRGRPHGARFEIATRADGGRWRRSSGDQTGVRRAMEAAGIRVLPGTSSTIDSVSAAAAHRPEACRLTVRRVRTTGSEMSGGRMLQALASVVGTTPSRARAALGSLQLVRARGGADLAQAPSEQRWPSTANGTDEDRS